MADMTTRPGAWTGVSQHPRARRDRLPVGLLTLWFATAATLVLAPFLTSYTRTVRAEGLDSDGLGVDGWGRLEGALPGTHDIRLGVLLVVAAGLLAVAGFAMAVARQSPVPGLLGLLGSGMAVAAGIIQALWIDSALSFENLGDDDLTVDVSIGAGTWLTWVAGVLAAVAAVLSWRQVRDQRHRTPPVHALAGRPDVRPSLPLLGLCLVMAVGLTVAPFLRSFTFRSEEDDPAVLELDGWGRWDSDVSSSHDVRIGVLCVVIAAALVVVVVAALVRRGSAWPYQLGLLAAIMAVAAGGFQLLHIDAMLANGSDDDGDVSVGIGAWLLTGMAGLALAAIVLAWVRSGRSRTMRPEATPPLNGSRAAAGGSVAAAGTDHRVRQPGPTPYAS